MKFKFIIISLFLLISAQTVCADLTVFFDCNRFLTENNNTIFEITYKIFHKDLQFEYFEDKLSAQIGVQCFIFDKQGKKLYNKFYSPMISASPGKTTIESEGFFIDKIIAEVTPGTYQFDIEIMDRLSGKKIVWNKILETLDTDELSISDLEINSFFKSDTTKSFTNFKRDNFIFLVNPNHLINPEESLGFAYYFEVYFPDTIYCELTCLQIEIFSKNDSLCYQTSEEFINNKNEKIFYDTISVLDWKPGTYKMIVKIKDLKGNTVDSTNEMLFIQKPEKVITDADIEAEFKYVKYLLTSYEKRIFQDLNNRAKLDFIKRFWCQNDPNPISEKNEFKEEIVKRTNYADKHFSHFEDGWKTDRGRIYIRQGQAEEVIDRVCEYRAKPYIIWKYYYGYSGGKKVYIFVDFTGQGNYKLVYRENDEKECTDPNWMDYLGPYFDVCELE